MADNEPVVQNPDILFTYPWWNLALFLLYLVLFVLCMVLLTLNRAEYVVKVRFFSMLVSSSVGGLLLTLVTCLLVPEDNIIIRRISYSLGIAAYFLFLCPYLVRAMRLRFMHEFSQRHLSSLQSYPSMTGSDSASFVAQPFFGNAAFMEWLSNSSREKHSEAHLAKWAFVAWIIVSVAVIVPVNILVNFNATSDPAFKAFTQRLILLGLTGIAVIVLAAAALVVRKSADKFSIQREIIVTSCGWILNFVINLACNLALGNTSLIANPIINTFFLILALLYSTFWPVLSLILARHRGRKNLSSGSFASSSSASTAGKDTDGMSMSSCGESGISSAPAPASYPSSPKPGRRDREELRLVLADKKGIQELEKFAAEEYSVENVLFYRSVDYYHNKPAEPLAKEIFENYIRPGSPFQVNLDERIVRELKATLYPPAGKTIVDMLREKGEPLGSIYNNAQKEVFEIMRKDTFSRFVLTKAYQDLVVRRRSASDSKTRKAKMYTPSPPTQGGFLSLLVPATNSGHNSEAVTPRRGSRSAVSGSAGGLYASDDMNLGGDAQLPPAPPAAKRTAEDLTMDAGLAPKSSDMLVDDELVDVRIH